MSLIQEALEKAGRTPDGLAGLKRPETILKPASDQGPFRQFQLSKKACAVLGLLFFLGGLAFFHLLGKIGRAHV